MDELLKRLRGVEILDYEEIDAFAREAMLDAADEIERLRALVRHADGVDDRFKGLDVTVKGSPDGTA